MKIRAITCTVLILFCSSIFAQKGIIKKTLKADKQFLLYPVNNNTSRKRLEYNTKNLATYLDIKISSHPDSIDYWVFMDVTRFEGQKLNITAEESDYMKKAFNLITLEDSIITDKPIYGEELRQQVHFSSRRGWNNDPNGLVYFDGEYHLFYQHNPYGWHWGNMHWGHAISKDLVHWEELPDALYPDELGTMFSGSAVIDNNNTTGWGKNALVAVYTANRQEPRHQVQCIAYSTDRGRTFTKYKGNPVINSYERWESHSTRDPKVFWYEPDNKWVMALYEVEGVSIYNSENLKDWTYKSHVSGFYECPELFELSVDDDEKNKKWVLYSASGVHKIGNFNGEEFITEVTSPSYIGGGMYAAQTYNNSPDGRKIQIGWGTISSEGMPFNQMMTFPTEMKLKTGPEGIRLHLSPIDEISNLYKNSYSYKDMIISQKGLNDLIKQPETRLLHIKCNLSIKGTDPVSVIINGHRITYNPGSDKKNETFLPGLDTELKLEFIADINSIEVFMNDGQFVKVIAHNSAANEPGISFEGKGQTIIEKLEIHELKSIWNRNTNK